MPDQVLGGARDPAGHVDGRLHGLAGLADLVRVGHPAGVDDGPAGAGGAVEQLGQLLDQGVVGRLAEAAPARDDDRGLVELGPAALLDVALDDLGRVGGADVGRPAPATTAAAAPPDGSAANDLARITKMPGPLAGEAGRDDLAAAEDRVLAGQPAVALDQARSRWSAPGGRAWPTGGRRRRGRRRWPGIRMASGALPALDERGDGGGHRHAGQRAAEVADVVEVVAPYSPSGAGQRRPRRRPRPRPRRSTPIDAGLGQQLERDRASGPLSPVSASTQTLSIAISDHLQLLEEGHDALRAVALVHHDLAGRARLGLGRRR